jgi:hypothetical protein
MVPWGGVVAGGLLLAVIGACFLADERPGTRERGWELQAVGVAIAAIGWLAGLGAAGVSRAVG